MNKLKKERDCFARSLLPADPSQAMLVTEGYEWQLVLAGSSLQRYASLHLQGKRNTGINDYQGLSSSVGSAPYNHSQLRSITTRACIIFIITHDAIISSANLHIPLFLRASDGEQRDFLVWNH